MLFHNSLIMSEEHLTPETEEKEEGLQGEEETTEEEGGEE